MASFDNRKYLRFIITIESRQITLEGFRSIAEIDKAGGMTLGTLRAQIYGVSQSDMNTITTLQWGPRSLKYNTVEVFAISGQQETRVFKGNIVNAWGSYQSLPGVFLQIQASAAYVDQLTPIAPTSIKGTVDVAALMRQLADKMGLAFENNNVSVTIDNPYLANTATEQVKTLAQSANIDLYIDDGVLAITPHTGPRSGVIPELSPDSGLIGYPTFDGVGVIFQILFNPAVTFGGSINLVTSIPRAAGTWVVCSVAHHLESERPGGAWFSTLRGNLNGLTITH